MKYRYVHGLTGGNGWVVPDGWVTINPGLPTQVTYWTGRK